QKIWWMDRFSRNEPAMSQLSLSARARVVLRNGLRPQTPIPRSHYATIVIGSVGLLLGLWALLSYGGFVQPTYFLPTPTEGLGSGMRMLLDGSLIEHAWASISVIVTGWALAAALAVPFGILMGSFKFFEALFEPVVNFVRYLPVSAMIPLLILYIGLGFEEKVAVIFIGTFFQLI